MAIYKYSEARQHLAELLQKAFEDGEVKIKRKDGVVFVLKPVKENSSPLDIDGLDLDIEDKEIVESVREGRRSVRSRNKAS